MVIVGMLFNPMNILAHKFDHLYFSTTLFYGGFYGIKYDVVS